MHGARLKKGTNVMPIRLLVNKFKKTSNRGGKRLGLNDWTRRYRIIPVIALFAVFGSVYIFKSSATTIKPSNIIDIDIESSESGDTGWIASLNGSGTAFVTRFGCSPDNKVCLNTKWESLNGSLKNVNIAYTSGGKALIAGGTGNDNRYYFAWKLCNKSAGEDNCTSSGGWSSFVSAGGNTSSLQTVLISNGSRDCSSVFANGTDKKVYSRQVCIGGGGNNWRLADNTMSNVVKLYKSSTVANASASKNFTVAVSGENKVKTYGFHGESESNRVTLVANGAYKRDSQSPIAFIHTRYENFVSAIGTDSRLYQTYSNDRTGHEGWHLVNNTAFLTDVYPVADGIIVRDYGGKISKVRSQLGSASYEDLGGNCSKVKAMGYSVICIGSDKKVYHRMSSSSDMGWHLL